MPSTVIADMNYDPASRSLRVRFVSGLIYEYLDVPEAVFASMKEAFSKGTYLNQFIKGHYDYRRIDG